MYEHDLCDSMISLKNEQEAQKKQEIDAAETLFKRGKQLLEDKKLLDAQDCFGKAIELDPFNREAFRLHEELRLRLGPSGDEDCTIFVRDPHRQLGTLILHAGECHSWFRREVPGVYDLAMYLATERGVINYENHRIVAIVICVFSHQYEAAKDCLEELARKIRTLWRIGATVRPAGGDELPPYFEVLLKPEYETQETNRLSCEKELQNMILAACKEEQGGDTGGGRSD